MNKRNQRRNFLKQVSVTSLGIASLPALTGFNLKGSGIKNIPENLTILFQGDSITDAGRNRGSYYPNSAQGMGGGYVFQIVADLMGKYPEKGFRFYNRGISGNKVHQLANRWEDDCLQLKPDLLSILIGVNDFWHTLTQNYEGTARTFESDLRTLLDRTMKSYPDIKLIIGEPFAVKGGAAINEKWENDFPDYQIAVKNIAKDYKVALIPYQKVFNDALKIAPVSYWCQDGVHPSMAGAYLMKNAWLEALSGIW
ncbi:SGNH/GDSL hydrolase family protein [Bacteroidota bacterium]